MTFTENLYLKRQLKQLQEENLKLKQILSEADILGGDIVDAFMQRTKPGSKKQPPEAEEGTPKEVNKFVKPLAKLTREEAFNLGVQHAQEHGGVKTPPHYFYDNNFVAGFNSVK